MIIDQWHKRKILRIKKTLEFISQYPNGVTNQDFKNAKLIPVGLAKLIQLEQVIALQIREPERGTRAYHWLWKLNRMEE